MIRISCQTSSLLYLTGLRVNILIVAKADMGNGFVPSVYYKMSREGTISGYFTSFTHNFGIDTSLYGAEDSGACLHGLIYIDLVHSSLSTNPRSSSLWFYYSGN